MKKKILIIDDSALMRKVLSDIINSDKELVAVDNASNGMIALEMIQNSVYDCILLDIQMPQMGGIEFMRQVSARRINVKIIVVSSVAQESGSETLRCLDFGAFDFVKKPSGLSEFKGDSFKNNVLKMVHCALESSNTARTVSQSLSNEEISKRRINVSAKTKKCINESKLVAIASSTGGPKALQEVIPLLPANIDAPVLLVQHMPEGFTKSLAERLNVMSEIKVKEAENGDILEKGTVYIAKGGCQLKINRVSDGINVLSTVKEPPRGGLRPCADIMLESIDETAYEKIICVVMTGMGSDATNGIMQLKKSKQIYVIAQNQETSIVYGMPRKVYEAGLTDEVLPLRDIAAAITHITGVH